MKLFNLLFILLITLSFHKVCLSQSYEEKYKQLKSQVDTIKINGLTFGEQYGSLFDEITYDLIQTNKALFQQTDSLKQTLSIIQEKSTALQKKHRLFLYVSIGIGILFLICFILLIVFIIKASKNSKKYKSTLIEIGKLNSELENYKQSQNQASQDYENLKNSLEESINELKAKLNQKQQELLSIKDTYQQEIDQLKELFNKEKNDYQLLKQQYEQTLKEHQQFVENSENIQASLKQELSAYVEKYKNIDFQEIDQLKNMLANEKNDLENLRNQYHQLLLEYEQYKQESQKLQENIQYELTSYIQKYNSIEQSYQQLKDTYQNFAGQIADKNKTIEELQEINRTHIATIRNLENTIVLLQQQLDKANKVNEKVNNELKNFIAELQTMLPLPR